MEKKEKIKQLLNRGVEEIIVKNSLAKKLETGKRLRIKFGVDPTAPRLHLGHTVALRKLRTFMELGHTAIFLVGDFTARIGDPSDKLSARKPLTEKEISGNLKLYKEQVGKILDLDKIEIQYNTTWHKQMDFAELFNLASNFSVNQVLERDMFKKRLAMKKPLWVHELLYPILQGYDSVALQADVELGGTDQTFNMLAARTLQPRYHQVAQDIMTVTLLEGPDGKEKMSKSAGNSIDILDQPNDMYGKLMSIPDTLIVKYFTLLTDVPQKDISSIKKDMQSGGNPRDHKAALAKEIVTCYHSAKEATAAAKEFEQVFKDKQLPSTIPTHAIAKAGSYPIVEVVHEAGLADSKSQARRLVEQDAVQFDGLKITDWKKKVRLAPGMVLQVGKHKFIKFVKK